MNKYDVWVLNSGEWVHCEKAIGDRKAIIRRYQGSHQQPRCGLVKVRRAK